MLSDLAARIMAARPISLSGVRAGLVFTNPPVDYCGLCARQRRIMGAACAAWALRVSITDTHGEYLAAAELRRRVESLIRARAEAGWRTHQLNSAYRSINL